MTYALVENAGSGGEVSRRGDRMSYIINYVPIPPAVYNDETLKNSHKDNALRTKNRNCDNRLEIISVAVQCRERMKLYPHECDHKRFVSATH